MKSGLVSVVIPVRNAEDYIEMCIESVRAQTYSKIEIITVLNDSSDRSEAICMRLATADPRVRVVNVKEPGVSKARNVGLDTAQGEYSMFVDADDFIYEGLIERLLLEMNEHGAVIATTGIEKYKAELLGSDRNDGSSRKLVTSHEYAQKMLLGSSGYYGYACCKLYRTSAIVGVRFDEMLAFSEDTDFLLKVLRKEGRVFVSSIVGYFYSQDTGGVTRDNSGEKRMKSLPVSEKFVNESPDKKLHIAAVCYYWRNAYYTLSQSKLSPAYQKQVWAIMNKYRMNVITAADSPLKYRIIALASFFGKDIFMKLATRLK